MENCVFCAISQKKIKSWVVAENENAIAILDARPVGPYHTLVIPKQHSVNMFDVSQASLQDVTALMHDVLHLYAQKLGIDSVQIFNNSGPNSAQTVFHLHFHILPRFEEDQIRFHAQLHPELVEQYPEMLARLQ